MQWGLPWPGEAMAAEAEAAGATAFCAGEFADLSAYVTADRDGARDVDRDGRSRHRVRVRPVPVRARRAVRHLSKHARGRVFLGLGAGTPRMNRDWFGVDADHPAPRMAELIEVIRCSCTPRTASRSAIRATIYSIDADIRAPVFGRLDVPILIGAFNRIMVRTAGRVADGVLGHGLFTDRWWDEVVDPELARGAESAGRDADSLHRWGWLITAIDDADPRTRHHRGAPADRLLPDRAHLRLARRIARLAGPGGRDPRGVPQRSPETMAASCHRRHVVGGGDLRRRRAGPRDVVQPEAVARHRVPCAAQLSGRAPTTLASTTRPPFAWLSN